MDLRSAFPLLEVSPLFLGTYINLAMLALEGVFLRKKRKTLGW